MTLPGSPSLVRREKYDPGAWRSSSPRRRVVVCQMNLRDGRIAPSLHESRWHAFCWRSVVIPAVRIRGSSSVSRAIGLLRALTNTDPVPKGIGLRDLIKRRGVSHSVTRLTAQWLSDAVSLTEIHISPRRSRVFAIRPTVTVAGRQHTEQLTPRRLVAEPKSDRSSCGMTEAGGPVFVEQHRSRGTDAS